MKKYIKSLLATLMLMGLFSSNAIAVNSTDVEMVEVRCAENDVRLHKAFTKLKQHIEYLYTKYSPAVLNGLDKDMEFIAAEAMWQMRPKSELIPGIHLCKDNQLLQDYMKKIYSKSFDMKGMLSDSDLKAVNKFVFKLSSAGSY